MSDLPEKGFFYRFSVSLESPTWATRCTLGILLMISIMCKIAWGVRETKMT